MKQIPAIFLFLFYISILSHCSQKVRHKEKKQILMADREAPLGWVYLRIYEDSTFEFESRGLERKGDIYSGVVKITADTLYFNYADSIPRAGQKAIYDLNNVAYIEGEYPETMSVKLNKISDTLKTVSEKKEQRRLKERKHFEDQEKNDSTNLDKILKEAIKIADQNKDQKTFKKKYTAITPDNSFEVDIQRGFYFTKRHTHLIIKRKAAGYIYIDIFAETNTYTEKVISHEQAKIEYTGDTIHDINGDGLKDFVVNWYGSAGCCLKGFSNVYLLRSDKKSFSDNFEFINPTFSPNEKVIRGVCYGHPGETEMYKYKWNGETVDTVEYIYYERAGKGEKTGKIIVSNNLPHSDNQKILRRLEKIPREYKKIDGYDWFTGNF